MKTELILTEQVGVKRNLNMDKDHVTVSVIAKVEEVRTRETLNENIYTLTQILQCLCVGLSCEIIVTSQLST